MRFGFGRVAVAESTLLCCGRKNRLSQPVISDAAQLHGSGAAVGTDRQPCANMGDSQFALIGAVLHSVLGVLLSGALVPQKQRLADSA